MIIAVKSMHAHVNDSGDGVAQVNLFIFQFKSSIDKKIPLSAQACTYYIVY